MVKFDRFEIYRVAMPLRQPWRARHLSFEAIETLLLRLDNAGESIWVESTPFSAPVFTSEWAAASFIVARDWLAPAVRGKSFATADELAREFSHVQGQAYAKALFDMAFWNQESKQRKTPLYQILGSSRTTVEVSDTLGVFDSIDELLAEIEKSVAFGFTTIKLKFCRGWELDMLRAVRSTFPKLNLLIDCNGAYSIEDQALFRSVDSIGLTMIEQPLGPDNLLEHAQLAGKIATPLCLDEGASSLSRVELAIHLKACQYVHVKLARVGGLSAAKAIHDLCESRGISCTVGSHLESAIGSEMVSALATLKNFKMPGTIFPSARQYAEDLAQEPTVLRKASAPSLEVCSAPGGHRKPDAHRLKAWTIESMLFES